MRITVIGPGAVGLLWAARLARAGQDVSILDHRPERAARIVRHGVTLEDATGQDTYYIPASAEPADLAQAELALVCVKAYHTKDAAQVVGQGLGADGRALTLQNGVGNLEALVDALGPGRVLGGITSEGSTLLAETKVRHAGAGHTHLGPAQGAVDDFAESVASVFRGAGFDCQAVEGAQNLIWTKLVINVGINALTAILEVPNGRLLELPPARELMEAAVAEAVAVGRAAGVEFLHQDMAAAVRQVSAGTAQNISSMLQDVRKGRRTEVGFINGAVVDRGAELGVATPVNQTLAGLVQAKEADRAEAAD